jgi:hypothetical protein
MATRSGAGVIPSGNGTDPWTLLRDYVKQQNSDRQMHEQMDFRQGLADDALAQRAAQNSPEAQYAKTDARLKARIANGFGPRSGGATSGKAVDTKNAAEFQAGLREGGISNPYAIALLMGNAQAESKFNTGALGDLNLGPGEEAHGTMQWRKERWNALQKFSEARGTPVTDPRLQGEYAAYELTRGGYQGVGKRLQALNSMEGGQGLMKEYLGYNPKVANEADRFATAQNWLKRDQGIKPNAAPQYATGLIHDPSDPTHIYRTAEGPDGVKFQLTNMPTQRASDMQHYYRKQFKDGGDRMIELVPDGKVEKGNPQYRIYSSPPPLPAVAAAPVQALTPPPAPAAPVDTTGSITPAPVPEEEDNEEVPILDPNQIPGD